LGAVFEQCDCLAEAESAFTEAWLGYKDLLELTSRKPWMPLVEEIVLEVSKSKQYN
jgi:hypothetical protein